MSTAGPSVPESAPRRTQILRGLTYVAAAAQALAFINLIVFIARHSNPLGDGMEWVAVVPGLVVLGVGTLPALVLSAKAKLLPLALCLALAGIALNVAFFFEIVSEMRH